MLTMEAFKVHVTYSVFGYETIGNHRLKKHVNMKCESQEELGGLKYGMDIKGN